MAGIKTGNLFIGGSLVMAIVSAIAIQQLAKPPEPTKPVEAKVQTQSVIVAKHAVPAGLALTKEDLLVVKWPRDYIPVGQVYREAEIDNLVGRVVKTAFVTGEPLYKQKLAGEGSSGGLPVLIPVGMRAITVGVSEIKGVAGFIKPGDRVDILTTYEIKTGGKTITATKTVLEDVMVLAIAQNLMAEQEEGSDKLPKGLKKAADEADGVGVDANKDGKPDEPEKKEESVPKDKKGGSDKNKQAELVNSVTFALVPKEVEKIVLAEETGILRLSLRPETKYKDEFEVSPIDAGGPSGGISTLELHEDASSGGMNLPPAPEPGPTSRPQRAYTAPTQKQVEFIQGVDREVISF